MSVSTGTDVACSVCAAPTRTFRQSRRYRLAGKPHKQPCLVRPDLICPFCADSDPARYERIFEGKTFSGRTTT